MSSSVQLTHFVQQDVRVDIRRGDGVQKLVLVPRHWGGRGILGFACIRHTFSLF